MEEPEQLKKLFENKRDPNGVLKQSIIKMEGPKSLPVSDKLKKLLIACGVSLLISIIAIIVKGMFAWLTVISMPTFLVTGVYASYLRFKQVEINENKLPEIKKEEIVEHYAPKEEDPVQINHEENITYK